MQCPFRLCLKISLRLCRILARYSSDVERVTAAAADYEGDVIIQQADDGDGDDDGDGEIENSDKRIGKGGRDGIDDCGGAFPGKE